MKLGVFYLVLSKTTHLIKKYDSLKTVLFALLQAFLTHDLIPSKFFVPKHSSNGERCVFHQLVCILACTKQNNTFYIRNLIHAKTVLFSENKRFSHIKFL